jgi:leader peptidase (prepilin peptidase)/N-methyltransferase
MTKLILPLFIGILSGAIVNILADTLPFKNKTFHLNCNRCGNSLNLWEYLSLSECKVCLQRKRWRMIIVYLLYILVAYWIANSPQRLSVLESFFTLIFFGVMMAIDIEYHAILYIEILIGIILGLVIGIHHHGLWRTLSGGIVGFLIMLGLYYLGILILKFRNRSVVSNETEALGFGDVNLMAVLGLYLGFPGIIVGLFLGVMTAGIYSFILVIKMLLQKKYHPDYAIPYGPFLVLGAAVLLFLAR